MSSSTRRFTSEQQQLAERVCAIGKDAYYEILQLNDTPSDGLRSSFTPTNPALLAQKTRLNVLVAEAWAVLGNAQKRAAYDQDRRRGSRPNLFDSHYASYDAGFFYGYAPPRDSAQTSTETREQRRERKFEERIRGNASAAFRARQEELARQQYARNVAEMLDSLGVEIHYCANCGTMHLHSRGEAMHHVPGSATQPVNPWAGDNTQATASPSSPESPNARRRKKNRQKNRATAVVVESEQSEPQSVAFTTYAMDLSLVAVDTIVIYCAAEVLPS
ncbi:hypothetical protein EXIGLDRAFT_776448 [Exidia glandulosa HHB12029]|uniref:J domain-containing protein n=1 Tax=Exidia glandulosa HHB12029 TaxID=1314781 RepID=A0A165DH23_EXIGL|nr:hypothetical protein EXIGLDRAFT_776448 [Exidia glandulosa HHB12029]